MQPVWLKINKTSKSNKCRLCLEGTVLLLEEKNKVFETQMQIPVELISISEGKKFRGKRLITSLLVPLGALIFFAISFAFVKNFLGISDDSIYAKICVIFSVSILMLSVVVFFVYLVMFFIRVKIVAFCIAPDGYEIEFWKSKKDAQKIDELITQIKQKQKTIESPFERPAETTIYAARYSPVLKFLIVLFLFAVPAMITENIYLLFLVLLPVIWFAYKGMLYLSQPKKYRKAMNLYLQKKWDKAINLLNCLTQELPQYLPAYTLLVDIYLRTNQFDEALSASSNLPDENRDLTQNMQTDIWYFKRIYQRRRKNTPT